MAIKDVKPIDWDEKKEHMIKEDGPMKFLIVIGRNALYTYEYNGQCFEAQFIEGSELFLINSNNVSESVKGYMEALANEKNLGTLEKLEFAVLEGAEKKLNKAIISALGDHVAQIYVLESVLRTVVKKLSRDPKLLIDVYGINYEGCSYKMENDTLLQGQFYLLAYTIRYADVVELMDI